MGDDPKDSFVFFRSFYESIKNVPEENQLEIYKALCEYSLNNVIPDNLSPISKALFILMKPNIDSSKKRYSASVENGKKGGRPRKNNNLEKPNNNLEKPSENLNETQEEPTQNLNVDVDVDVNDNVNINENIDDKKINKQPISLSKKTKHKYGEYKQVLLTDEEYKKLLENYGQINLDNIITYFDREIEMKGYKYKSHYLAILKWAGKAALEEQAKENRNFFKDFLES